MEEKNIEKEINYDEIKKMEEHARGYETAEDKKEFLKNIPAYEQKIILLNSKNPYDVLCYLDELDLKNSRLILEELSFEEINKILELFTLEDKQNFYKNFSDLSLVNKFIAHDSKADEYVKDLSLDRKVDLINSSDKTTVVASAKIYESLPVEERTIASESLNNSNSISALSEASTYVESNESIADYAESASIENSGEKVEILEDASLIEEELMENILEEKLEEEMKEEQIEKAEELETEELKIENDDQELEDELKFMKQTDERALDSTGEKEDSFLESQKEIKFSEKTETENFQEIMKEAEQDEINKIKAQKKAYEPKEELFLNIEVEQENVKKIK